MSTAPSNEVTTAIYEDAKPPFLRRVRIRGYKSIAFCDVTLEPLTILVGRNASGKSNFVDALAFLRDAMEFGVATAVKLRRGWQAIRNRGAKEDEISIEVELAFWSPPLRERPEVVALMSYYQVLQHPGDLTESFEPLTVTYRLLLTPKRQEPPLIAEEHCSIRWRTGSEFHFTVSGGKLAQTWLTSPPSVNADRILPEQPVYLDRGHTTFLSTLDALPFRDVASLLRSITCYNFHPDAMRRLQPPNPGWFLEYKGGNLASVIETTRANDEPSAKRMGRYLSAIVREVERLEVVRYGEYETVRFRLHANNSDTPLEFDAASMSDGTLRSLAALVAAFQVVLPHGYPSLVAIEEPETSLHPAAMNALVDALDEATLRTQILLTTHSAEMLDNPTIRPENIRVVQFLDGQTVIGPVDEASVEIVRRKLDTLGGLERQNQLEPDLDDQERQRSLSQNGREPKE